MSSSPSSNVLSTLTYLLTSGFIPSLDLDTDTSLMNWSQSTRISLKNIESSAEAASKETTNPELILCDFVAKINSHLELRGYPISDFVERGGIPDEFGISQPIVNQQKSKSNSRPSSARNSSPPIIVTPSPPTSQPLTSILKKSSSTSNAASADPSLSKNDNDSEDGNDNSNNNNHNDTSSSPTNNQNATSIAANKSSQSSATNHFASAKNSFPVKGGAQLLRHGNDVARVSRMAQRLAEEIADLQQAKIRMTSQHAQELNQQAASYRDIISELLEQQAKTERQLSEEMSRSRNLASSLAVVNGSSNQNFGSPLLMNNNYSSSNRMGGSTSSPIRF